MSQAAHVLAVQGTIFIPFHWSPLSFEFVVLVFFCFFYLHKQRTSPSSLSYPTRKHSVQGVFVLGYAMNISYLKIKEGRFHWWGQPELKKIWVGAICPIVQTKCNSNCSVKVPVRSLLVGKSSQALVAVQMLQELQWLMSSCITWTTFITPHVFIKVITLQRKWLFGCHFWIDEVLGFPKSM